MVRNASTLIVAAVLVALTAGACKKNVPPVVRPMPPPTPTTSGGGIKPPAPPTPIEEPVLVPPEPTLAVDKLGARSLDELNRDSPLQPVFYALDTADVSAEGQRTLQANAQVLKQYGTWQITIEGHCDERGTAEYNLALGERRAIAARDYLVSLGIPAGRVKTVSYGKEFPFDPAHNESAWSKNRRAHFVITAK